MKEWLKFENDNLFSLFLHTGGNKQQDNLVYISEFVRALLVDYSLTHLSGFDFELSWSFVVVGQYQSTFLDGVQQLGDGMFPTLFFHSAPRNQLILLHQVVNRFH